MFKKVLKKLHIKTKTQKRLDYLSRKVKAQSKEIEAIKTMLKAQAKNKK